MTDDATLVDDLPSPRLVVKVHGRVTQEVALRADVTIGRAEDNDLRLTDPRASRHHACVSREGVDFVLTDLGSANGTLLDGVRLTGPHRLKHGECISIGETEITYEEMAGPFEDTLAGPAVALCRQRPQRKLGEGEAWSLASSWLQQRRSSSSELSFCSWYCPICRSRMSRPRWRQRFPRDRS